MTNELPQHLKTMIQAYEAKLEAFGLKPLIFEVPKGADDFHPAHGFARF